MFKRKVQGLSKEREMLLNEKECVVIYKNYYDIIENIKDAYAGGMPYIPLKDWLVRFETTTYIEVFNEEHIKLIEMLKISIKEIANSYGYTMNDANGYLVKLPK